MAAFRQFALGAEVNGGSSATCTFASATLADSIIVAATGWSNSSGTATFNAFSGGSGSYTDCGQLSAGPQANVYTRLAANFSPAAGTTVITVTFNNTTDYTLISAWEVTGLVSPSWDQSQQGHGSSTAVATAATAALAASGEVAFFMSTSGSSINAVGGGWTASGNNGVLDSNSGWAWASQITPNANAITGSGTNSPTGNFSAIVGAIKVSGAVTYSITGATRDNVGNLLGSCNVSLLKYNSGTHLFTQVAHTTSDASTGAYIFGGLADNDPSYSVVAWKDGTPHVYDVSDRSIKPV